MKIFGIGTVTVKLLYPLLLSLFCLVNSITKNYVHNKDQ